MPQQAQANSWQASRQAYVVLLGATLARRGYASSGAHARRRAAQRFESSRSITNVLPYQVLERGVGTPARMCRKGLNARHVSG